MGEPTAPVRKTFKYTLCPTREHERVLDRCLMRCRHVYHAAIGERRDAWRMRGICVTSYPQKAEVPGIQAALPEYAEVHAQVLPDVVLRVDRACAACCQRIHEGSTAGFPRFHGRNRYNRLTDPQLGNGATLDNGFLVRSTIGRIAVRWSRPLQGSPKTVTIRREADGWYVGFSCAAAPMRRCAAAPLRRCAVPAPSAHRPANGHGPGVGVMCHPGGLPPWRMVRGWSTRVSAASRKWRSNAPSVGCRAG